MIGFQARVAEDHFVQVLAGRVAVVGGLDVQRQLPPQSGNPLQEGDGHTLALSRVVRFVRQRVEAPFDAGFVLQGAGDLRRQRVVQAVDQVADVVGDVADVQPLTAAIAGVEDVLQVLDRRDDLFVFGQRAMPQVVDRADGGVGLDDFVGQVRAGVL